MIRFLIFYFVAYGGAHLYFYLKLKRAFTLSLKRKLVFISVLTFFFCCPLIARKLESSGFDIIPEILSGCGYLWMGLLFLFITAAAFIDLLNLLLAVTLRKKPAGFMVQQRPLFLLAAAYTLVIGSYGYYEAKNIVAEQLTIKSSRVPATVKRIRIVQISDLHVGQIVREERIKTVLSAVKAASPDILVSTGDLVDGHQRHFSGLERLFLEVKPKFGKFAVLGNHEYYVGIEEAVKFMNDAGFKVLNNQNFELGGIICLTGVDDSPRKPERAANAIIEGKLLNSAAAGAFRLLLKHRPVVEKGSEGKFDLQLSGHVHKGQIFPFNILTWLSFPVRAGLTKLNKGSLLYVSRGTGVWGPPIRFLAPPEITIIDLIPDPKLDKNI